MGVPTPPVMIYLKSLRPSPFVKNTMIDNTVNLSMRHDKWIGIQLIKMAVVDSRRWTGSCKMHAAVIGERCDRSIFECEACQPKRLRGLECRDDNTRHVTCLGADCRIRCRSRTRWPRKDVPPGKNGPRCRGRPCCRFADSCLWPCRGTLSRMTVLSVTTGLLKLPPTLVAPCNVMPFVIMRGEVQLASPAGTITVSPSWAEAMADLTSASSALFASTVAPFALPAAGRNMAASARR